MSLRASITGELNFGDCFIPDDHYLPGTEKGLSAALKLFNRSTLWYCMGRYGGRASLL